MIAYVATQGARIVREGKRLLVRNDSDTHHTLFIWKLEQLLIFGNVSITPPALGLLLREGVDTVFLRADGRYLGRLAPEPQANVFLRKRQFHLTDDPGFILGMAKTITEAKIQNQATVLARIKRARNIAPAREAADDLRRLARKIADAPDLDAVRGLEGAAAARYFKTLPLGLTKDFGFVKRVRRPPTDPVNAVLSLLYTLLINRCHAAVRCAGLDPQPGALHALEYGRNSLPLDLVEEFRPILADTLTLALFNLGVLDWPDFECRLPAPARADAPDPLENAVNDPLGRMSLEDATELADLPGEQLPPTPDRPAKPAVLLSPAALRRVLAAFSKRMETAFFHPVAEKEVTYAQSLEIQARLYRRVVEGQAAAYRPLLLR